MKGHNEGIRRIDDPVLLGPTPAESPIDMRLQLPRATGNEGLTKGEVDKLNAKQQVEQSDASPIYRETPTLTHNSIVFPETKK